MNAEAFLKMIDRYTKEELEWAITVLQGRREAMVEEEQ